MTQSKMKFWMDIPHTLVLAELVSIAADRTKKKVEYREVPDYHRNGARQGHLWTSEEGYVGDFTDELTRLQSIITEPLREPVLEDDYPVYQGRLYVADGKVREFIDGMNMTVGRWKALRIPGVASVTEVRRCDIVGRRKRLSVEKIIPKPKPLTGWNESGKGIRQAKRRPRKTHKIKRVS